MTIGSSTDQYILVYTSMTKKILSWLVLVHKGTNKYVLVCSTNCPIFVQKYSLLVRIPDEWHIHIPGMAGILPGIYQINAILGRQIPGESRLIPAQCFGPTVTECFKILRVTTTVTLML